MVLGRGKSAKFYSQALLIEVSKKEIKKIYYIKKNIKKIYFFSFSPGNLSWNHSYPLVLSDNQTVSLSQVDLTGYIDGGHTNSPHCPHKMLSILFYSILLVSNSIKKYETWAGRGEGPKGCPKTFFAKSKIVLGLSPS
jgi:hypothetical protein